MLKELKITLSDNKEKLTLDKSKSTFLIYALLFILLALLFIKELSNDPGNLETKWPFYIAVIAMFFISTKYLKTVFLGHKLIFDKSNNTVALPNGNKLSFDEILFILVQYKNSGDSIYCYFELVLQNGNKYKVLKSDSASSKNIERAAYQLGDFLCTEVKVRNRPKLI